MSMICHKGQSMMNIARTQTNVVQGILMEDKEINVKHVCCYTKSNKGGVCVSFTSILVSDFGVNV